MYTQIIDVLDPPHRLVMRSVPEPGATSRVTTYTVQEERGGARLTVTNAGYELLPEETRWNDVEQSAFGFGMMLENIQALIEGRSLPYPGGF